MRRLTSPTGKRVFVQPVWPNAGVESWYRSQLDAIVAETATDLVREITRAWERREIPVALATDSAIRAAGIAFTDIAVGTYLLLHRTDGQGWAFPGGHVEDGETDEEAAIREVGEELADVPPDATLHGARVTHHGAVRFATYTVGVCPGFTPTLLGDEHDSFQWLTPTEALALPDLHPGVRQFFESPSIAQDAAEPTKRLQVAMRKWGSESIRRFDDMAAKIARDFAERNKNATEVAMRAKLKAAGFTVSFRPTSESVDAFRKVVNWNVDLIKSIPRKYYDKVIKRVFDAVAKGSDLHTLTLELQKVGAITRNRAALIARDQNAKAKASFEQTRRLELGIQEARWRHSHAGKEPRPSHVEASKKGVVYNIRQGWFDPDEGRYIQPGELIECRCSSDAIIPGFVQ